MCGLVGMIGLEEACPRADVLTVMADAIRHRGPDDSGLHISGNVGFAFRRLSIIDVSPTGHQPMLSKDGQIVLVFNGEIYNFVELREELKALGHTFRSSGDTEVLLHAYQQWGAQCVEKLNGMWAFLIYDARSRRVIASRDRFGKKPLYWHRHQEYLFFASEIKAIVASGYYQCAPNLPLVAQWFYGASLDQIPTEGKTFYAGIEEIHPGTVVEVDLDGNMTPSSYWTWPAQKGSVSVPPEQEFGRLFEDAVRLRLRSDVPVGMFLSGGIDSTSIACAVARLRGTHGQPNSRFYAFTFQADSFDERSYIAETVKQTGVELVPYCPNGKEIWNQFERMLWFQDEPVHSLVAVITFELSRLAAERGVKVILNGGGADEYLGGYLDFFESHWQDVIRSQGPRAAWEEIKAYTRLHGGAAGPRMMQALRLFVKSPLGSLRPYRRLHRWKHERTLRAHPWFTEDLFALLPVQDNGWSELSLPTALQYAVSQAPLPFYLRMEDRNSMAHSTEARMPFLDYRLVSLAAQLSNEWKTRGGWNKFLLRESMRGRIPERVRARPEKWGFPIPTRHWVAHELGEPIQDVLSSQAAKERGIYRMNTIWRDLELHQSGCKDVSSDILKLVQLELWSQSVNRFAHSVPSEYHPEASVG
jgi:asparagine synthase (glutamine-hydrolysing)